MITQTELNAIKERAEKATPGPWEYIESDNVIITLDDDYHFAMEVAEELGHGFDGTFIAHAREDIPKLVAEIERLKSAIAEAISDIETISPHEAKKTLREALESDEN